MLTWNSEEHGFGGCDRYLFSIFTKARAVLAALGRNASTCVSRADECSLSTGRAVGGLGCVHLRRPSNAAIRQDPVSSAQPCSSVHPWRRFWPPSDRILFSSRQLPSATRCEPRTPACTHFWKPKRLRVQVATLFRDCRELQLIHVRASLPLLGAAHSAMLVMRVSQNGDHNLALKVLFSSSIHTVRARSAVLPRAIVPANGTLLSRSTGSVLAVRGVLRALVRGSAPARPGGGPRRQQRWSTRAPEAVAREARAAGATTTRGRQ
jgi:hypothetical protein